MGGFSESKWWKFQIEAVYKYSKILSLVVVVMSGQGVQINPKNNNSSADGIQEGQNGSSSLEIPFEPSTMDISGEGAKIFITDAEDEQVVPEEPKVSKLKSEYLDHNQGGQAGSKGQQKTRRNKTV